ncbi:uncharacterized protein LOC130990770 [Salvia miltiorrhiza]|uniref:uncharacterized protein LOC130990770 n=1 Tax=Salvia miltiorrhiza TaxID=226208 RepID=UPI0025ABDD4D|nr:uncharacterized protein LOC130990770 [Salvia miltiorrhiza]
MGEKKRRVVSLYEVSDIDQEVFNVSYNGEDKIATCGCKNFEKIGLLCRHIFVVYINLKIECIPEKNVVSRWTKYAPKIILQEVDSTIDAQCSRMEDNKYLMNQLHSEFFETVGLVEGDTDQMNIFLRGLRDLKQMLAQQNQSDVASDQQLFDRYYGYSLPKEVSVLPPDPVKNKGSGSRLKSRKEKEQQLKNKPLRRCSKCRQMRHHDARNCDEVSTTWLRANS